MASLDTVIDKGSANLALVGKSLRADLVATLSKESGILNKMRAARELLDSYRWLQSKVLSETQVAGWVLGADEVLTQVPASVRDELAESVELEDEFKTRRRGARRRRTRVKGGHPDSPLAGGATATAKSRLHDRKAISRKEFAEVRKRANKQTVKIIDSFGHDVLNRVRQAARKQRDEDLDPAEFADLLTSKLETSKIGDGESGVAVHYGVTSGHTKGQAAVASKAKVTDIVPFFALITMRDERVRNTHTTLEVSGLEGTNIYWASDTEFWNVFSPPFEWG